MANKTTDHICWGILGCGDVCEVKSGPALQKAGRSSVRIVMRRDGAKAADYARRHGVAHWTDDADTLLTDPEIDAVYIATPPSTHADYAIRAVQAGKHVLLEKPMALTVAECDAVIAAQKSTGRKLCVAYYRRALPRFEHFRQIAQSGEIGALRMVEIRHFLPTEARPDQPWKIDPAIGGGGFFTDMQTHTLDWLGHAFGAPVAVRGLRKFQAGAYAAEDLVSYILDFDGFPAMGLCAYAVDHREEGVTLHGSEGSAQMGFFRPSAITLTRAGETKEVELPDPPHVHQPFVERVVAHLLDDAPNPCSADAGRQVNALVERIFAGI
ncbi:Gfo/Idh/MocA family protein [Tropicimonas marinistellae]|uniref:Gfo/Idh/MocA family protein n=1 Tax=Tropicimonas marinistellae TaxID=1739787 RepID=UPI00083590D1|nr:Gfo/Idh/MocA family oxidoreductase [Tropicimonas marinistellae]